MTPKLMFFALHQTASHFLTISLAPGSRQCSVRVHLLMSFARASAVLLACYSPGQEGLGHFGPLRFRQCAAAEWTMVRKCRTVGAAHAPSAGHPVQFLKPLCDQTILMQAGGIQLPGGAAHHRTAVPTNIESRNRADLCSESGSAVLGTLEAVGPHRARVSSPVKRDR